MIRDISRISPLALPMLMLVVVVGICGLVVRYLHPIQVFATPGEYLALHSLLELVSIAVSLMVFSLGWALRKAERSGRGLILGIASASVGLIDFLHMFSYAGMPDLVTPSSSEKAINFWLLGRLVMAVALLVAAMAPNQRLSGRQYGWGVLGLCLFSAVAIVGGLSHPDWFPRTFVAGMGLTTFKVVCEYVLALVYIAAATRLVGRYKREGDANDLKLALAAWILALSGVLLTLYGDTTDLFNLLGHVAKAVAYVLIYNALFVSGVRVPYVALSQERALLRTLMDSIPDLIFFKDRSSRYLGYNKAFAAYCGRPEEEMAGKTDDEFVAPQIAEFYREKDREAMAAAQPSCNEEWIDYPDGRHVLLETIKSRFFAPDGALLGLIGISRDITERNLAEARLRRAHHELEMVTYVASHDLQEPVRTVASFLQLLKLRYGGKLGEDADQYIDYAVAGVHRMREQLTGLLEFSRVGHSVASFRPTDMDTVLAEVMAGFDTALSEMGAVVVHDHLPVVMADAAQMRSLLQNLIANAIKYHSSERNLEIHVTATQMGSEWRFTVRDNGIGIAREYWEKIFEIFQRLHTLDRYEGTGIGLAICRKIVDRHGGRIWVDSIPGQGSSFTFSLPIRS